VEEDTSGDGGLFQFGTIDQGAFMSTSCGSGQILGYMVERRVRLGPYLCNAYSGTFGSQHKFSVLRAADGSGFRAYLDGNVFAGPYALGFPSQGVAVAVGEYNDAGAAPTSYDFVWGPIGSTTPWQNTVDHGATWITVSNSAGVFAAPGWTVQGVPSPFHIYR
jgi:hypothetical protein